MASVRDLLGRTSTVQGAYQALDGLINLAFTDPTTNLPNRRALDEVTKLPLGFAGPSFGIVMIDLTGFKRVNDEGSHAAGDAALGEVGRTLSTVCALDGAAPLGLPFRYGGDEFCILVPSESFEAFVEESNLSHLRWPEFTLEEKALGFGASIGFSAPDEDVGLSVLIERADAAAKASKQQKDVPVRWSATLARYEMVSKRRRCMTCSATVTIQIASTDFKPEAFGRCANCQQPM